MELQLPNDRTRVGWLLDAIKECADKDVTAALAAVCLDDEPGGMRHDFERAVTFMLPTDPVKKRTDKNNKCCDANISVVSGPPGKGKGRYAGKKTNFKVSTGSTGVELRYYKNAEFKKLTHEQQKELTTHRRTNGNYTGSWTGKSAGTGTGTPRNSQGKFMTQDQVASLLVQYDARKLKKDEEKEELINEMRTEFQALLQPKVGAATATNTIATRAKKRASVGDFTTAADEGDATTIDVVKAEAAAEVLLSKFGNQFAKLGSKPKEKKKKTG